jgi:hypothetical protein
MSLIIALIILGVIFYFIEMVPMAQPFPRIIQAVAIIIALVLVLQFLGVHLPFAV